MHKLTIFFSCLLVTASTHAAYSDFTDYGWYTRDGISGLYWLDVTETQNLSVLEVRAELQPGGRFDGWRYAHFYELEQMWQNLGIGRQGNPCIYTGARYCDNWSGDDKRVAVSRILKLFGNNYNDPYVHQSYLYEVPLYPQRVHGLFADEDRYLADPDPWVGGAFVRENDATRSLFSHDEGGAIDLRMYDRGAWLVRDSVPAPLAPLPDTTPAGAIDFANVMPADLGLQFACIGGPGHFSSGQYGTYSGYCSGHYIQPQKTSTNTFSGVQEMKLGLSASFDRQATPFLRFSGFDFRPAMPLKPDEVCIPDPSVPDSPYQPDLTPGGAMYIDDAEGRHFITEATVEPAPQGGGWCRVRFALDYQYLPPLGPDSVFSGIATALTIGGYSLGVRSPGTFFDNLLVEMVTQNIIIDFDPWSALNEIRPKDDYYFGLMIKTTSVSAGDAYDFDAATVDAASLRLGPNGATNIAQNILSADYDADGDLDYIFAFRVDASGLSCLDRKVSVQGRDTSGNPLVGIDIIVPINCDEQATIDVDPWNTANIVRPNDSYTVPVAIMSTQIANGDSGDIDATQVNPASLRFGPNQAPHTGATIVGDLDGDADTDVVFGFNAYDSGIACGDTTLTMEGNLYDSLPIVGMDSISTTDCEGGCHP